MFLTYTGLRNLYGDLTNNSTSSNLTLGDKLITMKLGEIYGMRDWYFMYKTATANTVGSTQFYDLPYDVGQLLYVTITVSTTTYSPKRAPSRRFWDELNVSTSVTSNTPEWYFVFNDQVGFYPKPSSATTNGITFSFKKFQKELTVADYTTGTILTTVVGDETIVGGSTSWTDKMAADRWIRITDSDSDNTGDGIWYEIASITDSTNLEMKKGYQGIAITTGTANYTIGQASLLPRGFHQLPVYGAAEIYYTSIKPNATMAQLYKGLYQDGIKQLTREHGSSTTDPSIESRDIPINNPNFFVEL